MTDAQDYAEQLAAKLDALAADLRSGRALVSEVDTSQGVVYAHTAEGTYEAPRLTGERTLTVRYWKAP